MAEAEGWKKAEETLKEAEIPLEETRVPESGSKNSQEKSETYTYPVKDTERRLKKSERLHRICRTEEKKERKKKNAEEKGQRKKKNCQ